MVAYISRNLVNLQQLENVMSRISYNQSGTPEGLLGKQRHILRGLRTGTSNKDSGPMPGLARIHFERISSNFKK